MQKATNVEKDIVSIGAAQTHLNCMRLTLMQSEVDGDL